jgi:hypothetical protein
MKQKKFPKVVVMCKVSALREGITTPSEAMAEPQVQGVKTISSGAQYTQPCKNIFHIQV